MAAYDVFFYQPTGTDIEPYPFDGALTEANAAAFRTAIGAVTGVTVQNNGTPDIDSPFGTLNFANHTTLTASAASAGGGVCNITFALNLSAANIWLADQVVPAEAYGAGWNGSNEVPTKNDIYDKIEAVIAGISMAMEVV